MAGNQKSADKVPIWVRWFARDVLDGTVMLSAMEELAYRRILDLIYVNGDCLRDDDRAMAWMTKSGRQWHKVKARLLELGKITVEDGFIRNHRASEECTESRSFMARKSAAGRASAEARKTLKNHKATSTAVATAASTTVPTEVTTNNMHTKKVPATQGAGASGSSEAAEGAEQTPAQCLYAEGLAILAELTGKELPKHREPLAKLMGKLRREAGDDGLVLTVIRDAGAKPPRDPVSWLRAQIKAKRNAGPRLALDNPADDPWGIQAWCPTLPGVSATTDPEDRKRGKWLWRGRIIDATAQRVCMAAGLPRSWRGSLDAVTEWIAGGFPADALVDTIMRCASRDTYAVSNIRSLAFFGAAVHEQAGRRAA